MLYRLNLFFVLVIVLGAYSFALCVVFVALNYIVTKLCRFDVPCTQMLQKPLRVSLVRKVSL
jgi:hypothetical protein